MRHLLYSFSFLCFVVLLTTSCNKKGDTGAPGKDGNVVNTADSFSLANTNYTNGWWTMSTGSGSAQAIAARVAAIDVSKLTDKVLKTGTVLVYMKQPTTLGATTQQYVLLPFSLGSSTTGYTINYNFAFELGKLRIFHYYIKTDAAATAPSVLDATIPTNSFRYVIIPGSEGYRAAQPPVDYSDYEAVKRYYNLPY